MRGRLVERMLELAKRKRVRLHDDSFSDMSVIIQVGTLESIISYLDQYEKKELHKNYELELRLDQDFSDF
jgi:hypothetical protein